MCDVIVIVNAVNGNRILYCSPFTQSSMTTNRHRYEIGIDLFVKVLFETNTCFDALIKYPLHSVNVSQIQFPAQRYGWKCYSLFWFLLCFVLVLLQMLAVPHCAQNRLICYVMRRVHHGWQLINHAKLIERLCFPFEVKICWFNSFYSKFKILV